MRDKLIENCQKLGECIIDCSYLFAKEKADELLDMIGSFIIIAKNKTTPDSEILSEGVELLNTFYTVIKKKHQNSQDFIKRDMSKIIDVDTLTKAIIDIPEKVREYCRKYGDTLLKDILLSAVNKLNKALKERGKEISMQISIKKDSTICVLFNEIYNSSLCIAYNDNLPMPLNVLIAEIKACYDNNDEIYLTRLEQMIFSIRNAAWALDSDYSKLIKMIVKLAKALRRFEKRFHTPTLVDDAYLTRVQEFTYGENSHADLLIFNILNSFNFENIFAELSKFKIKNKGLKYQKVIDMLKQLEIYLKAQDPENPTISYTEIKSRVNSILMELRAPWLTKASSLFTASILSISLLSGCAHDNKTASSCENDLPSEPSTTMVNTIDVTTPTMESEQEVTDMFDPQSSIALYHYRKLKDQDTGDMIFRIMKNTYVTKCSMSPIDFYNEYNISEVDEDINIEGDLTKTVHGFKDIASNSEFYIASIEDAKGNILLTENMFYDTYEGIAFRTMSLNIGNKTKYRYSPSWYDINFEIHSASEAFGFDQIPMSDLLEFLSELTPEDIQQDLNKLWEEYCSGASLNSKPDKVISFGPCKKNNWN